MDFIVDNYFWFIVGGIVIIMIVIGFIAERTNFGRKPFSDNNTTSKEKKEVTNVKVENNIPKEEVAVIPETEENISNVVNFDDGLNDIKLQPDLNMDVQTIGNPAVENIPIEQSIIPEQPNILSEEKPEQSNVVQEEIAEVINDNVVNDTDDDVWKF